MKLQFRTKDGTYMFSLIDNAAEAQLTNLIKDSCFKAEQREYNHCLYNCLVCKSAIRLVFCKYTEVHLIEGDYIKIIP